MKKISILFLLIPILTKAQTSCTFNIYATATKEPIKGATIQFKKIKLSGVTDSAGKRLFINIPNGEFEIEISSVGYKDVEKEIRFPLKTAGNIQVYLEQAEQELDEVTVNATRSNRSIRNTPARVEVVSEEEVHEEATMRPGDIKMLLSESTGIQAQQTSATTGNASIRIQGLDGRYSQILKDGFPIYSGAAGGLGLLQTPPLDLKQVEIIKGSSSTLYGGGAIAGLVNLVTKVPTEKRELNFHFNITSAKGFDASGFYSQRFEKVGVTMFISRNSNKAFDPANIMLSAIPKFQRYTVNPKLFLYFNDKTKLNFGINTSFENRLGGDMNFIAGKPDSIHNYFERNKTKRFSTQFTFDHQPTGTSSVKIKNSIGYFNRVISSNNYNFNGTQYSSFTEATYINKMKHCDWVAGVNVLTDQFEENQPATIQSRNCDQTTFGVFLQNTWNSTEWLILETGLRGDYVNKYGFALLPKFSALFKISPAVTSRLGGGLGYKPPTIFSEESERLLYKNILPVTPGVNNLERSYGGNWDVTYKLESGKTRLSINQFFFYTYLDHPLLLENAPNNFYQFMNITGHVLSKGAETNIRLSYDELALYLGYTFTDAMLYNSNTESTNPLTPKHRFNAALVYEVEGKWKFGSELYYFSKQQLTDGTQGRGYWLSGLVAERQWSNFSLFINFENLGNVRQTKFESIYTGSITNPVFKDIYAPLEGFVVNGGVKIIL